MQESDQGDSDISDCRHLWLQGLGLIHVPLIHELLAIAADSSTIEHQELMPRVVKPSPFAVTARLIFLSRDVLSGPWVRWYTKSTRLSYEAPVSGEMGGGRWTLFYCEGVTHAWAAALTHPSVQTASPYLFNAADPFGTLGSRKRRP